MLGPLVPSRRQAGSHPRSLVPLSSFSHIHSAKEESSCSTELTPQEETQWARCFIARRLDIREELDVSSFVQINRKALMRQDNKLVESIRSRSVRLF